MGRKNLYILQSAKAGWRELYTDAEFARPLFSHSVYSSFNLVIFSLFFLPFSCLMKTRIDMLLLGSFKMKAYEI